VPRRKICTHWLRYMALSEHVSAEGSSMSLLLLFNQGPVYQQLLREAAEHHAAARHRECVIFAQIAAEVAADDCLTRLIAKVEPRALRVWLKARSKRASTWRRRTRASS